MLRNKLMTASSVALITAALYGCSSISDDGVNMKVQDLQDQISALEGALGEGQELTPETLAALVSDLETADGRVTELETMIGAETDPAAESLRGMLAQANMDLMDANSKLEMAMDNSADEMVIAGLRRDVTDAAGMRDSYKTMLDTANANLVTVTKERDDAKTELTELRKTAEKIIADAEDKEASDMAKAVLEAIGRNIDTLAGPATVTASSAGVLTATQAGYTMSAAPEEIDGWRGRTLANDGDTTVIYTNIADAVATPIGHLYRSTTLQGKTAAYKVTDTGDDQNVNWNDAKRADDVVTETGAGMDLVAMFAGSVRGVAGVFSCAAAECAAPTETGGGPLDGEMGDWTFTPTDPNGTVDVPNTAYVSFGWWLNAMGTDGAYEFDAFATAATGMGDAVDGLPARDVSGTATYRGAAAGKYAIQSTTDDSASGGHFTAAATLTANFDTNTAAVDEDANDNVSIGGTITGFMTGETSRPNWKVTLTTQVADSLGPIIDTDAKTTWSTGGAAPGKGTWSANFYGGEEDTGQPTAAIGEFNAAIGGGEIARISGAFAATK